MARARIRMNYVVENQHEIINFKLQRGDTVYNMEDSLEYLHTSYAKPLGYTLYQLNAMMTTVSAEEKAEEEANIRNIPEPTPELIIEEEVEIEEPAPKKRAKRKTKTEKDA